MAVPAALLSEQWEMLWSMPFPRLFHRIDSGSTFARKLGILRHCRTRSQQQRANCYHYFLLHITVNVFCFHLIIINALVCPSVEDEHIKDGEKAFLYSKAAQYTIITIKMSQATVYETAKNQLCHLQHHHSIIHKSRMTEYISRSIKEFENSGHREERLTG